MSARRRRWRKLRERAEAAGVTPEEVRRADLAAAALSTPPLYVVTVAAALSPEAASRVEAYLRRTGSFRDVLTLEPGVRTSVRRAPPGGT